MVDEIEVLLPLTFASAPDPAEIKAAPLTASARLPAASSNRFSVTPDVDWTIDKSNDPFDVEIPVRSPPATDTEVLLLFDNTVVAPLPSNVKE